MALQPVSSGTSDLLTVLFYSRGKIVVNDVTDVGFVDAHTEGDGCDHDGYSRCHKFVLDSRLVLRFHTCVE